MYTRATPGKRGKFPKKTSPDERGPGVVFFGLRMGHFVEGEQQANPLYLAGCAPCSRIPPAGQQATGEDPPAGQQATGGGFR